MTNLQKQHDQVTATSAREVLRAIAHDFSNDYLTVERYAECNGLSIEHAKALLELARIVEHSPHPES